MIASRDAMPPFVRQCPRCAATLEAVPAERGVLYDVCPECNGAFVEARDLEAVIGGPLPSPEALELPNPFDAGVDARALVLTCPDCLRATLVEIVVGSLDRGVRHCDSCGGCFFEMSAFVAVRGMTSDGERAPRISIEGLELDERALRRATSTSSGSFDARPPASSKPPREPTPPPIAEAIRTRPIELDTIPDERPPLTRAEKNALLGDDGTLTTARLRHDEPWTRLLVLPVVLSFAWMLGLSDFGRLLSTPFSIQFHEMGHAIPAWLSGRAALPLPCGMTFWSKEPSLAAHLVVLAFSTLLVVRGIREWRPFAVVLAVVITSLQVTLSLVLDASTTSAIVLASGCAGEMILSAAALVAFFFRMPDRLRWDFFRFLVAPFAAIAFVSGFRLWLDVLRGRASAPIGSILGTVGDGSGDLERLVHDHGIPLASLVRGYAAVGFVSLAVLIAVYTAYAAVAVREIENRRRAG